MSDCNTGQDLKSLRGKMPPAPIVVTDLSYEIGSNVYNEVTKTTTFTANASGGYTSTTVYTNKWGEVITGGKEVPNPERMEVVSQPTKFTVGRKNGEYEIAGNTRKSYTITSFSSDVVINGAPVPANFTWHMSGNENGFISTELSVSGTDYLVTETTS